MALPKPAQLAEQGQPSATNRPTSGAIWASPACGGGKVLIKLTAITQALGLTH